MSTLIVIGMVVAIVIVHEAAHALTAILLGFKLKRFFLGIPISIEIGGKKRTTTVWSKQFGDVEFGISWLFMGGAVDFYDFDEAPVWKTIPVLIAGPISNALMAYLVLLYFVGPVMAWTIFVLFFQAIWSGLIGIFSGLVPASQISGPVGFVTNMSDVGTAYTNGWLMVWVMINIALFITNALPIPALDGGQVVMAVLEAILGERSKKPIKYITYGFLYAVCSLMVFICILDFVKVIQNLF